MLRMLIADLSLARAVLTLQTLRYRIHGLIQHQHHSRGGAAAHPCARSCGDLVSVEIGEHLAQLPEFFDQLDSLDAPGSALCQRWFTRSEAERYAAHNLCQICLVVAFAESIRSLLEGCSTLLCSHVE